MDRYAITILLSLRLLVVQDAVNIYVRTVLKHTLLQVANTPTSACVSIAVNSYAQAVRDNGEAAADAALRQATTRIAENGEIIRDFPGAAAA